ncbi:MAG: hypothetical protein AAF471_03155 [Myxococcota bacterium]
MADVAAERTPTVEKEAETLTLQKRSIGLSFGPTVVSRRAMEIAQSAHKIRLPQSLSKTPKLEDLIPQEIARIYKKHGDDAFINLRERNGNPLDRGQLLKRRHKAGGGERIHLTAEAERELKRKKALVNGYIGPDRMGNEQLVKVFQVGNRGLLEIGLSWQGMAGPLVEEWRDQLEQQMKQQKKQLSFASLGEEKQNKINRMLERNRLWNNGTRIMECILGQVGRQRRNPIEIPAEALRVLLWPDCAKDGSWPQNWKYDVDSTLSVLRSMCFTVKTHQMETVQAEGNFIGEWCYAGLGQGAHGDGVYIIDVQEGFLGCLRAFAIGKTKLRNGREVMQLDLGKEIDSSEREQLGWRQGEQARDSFLRFDAGRVFYSTAAGLTPKQENILAWIEKNLTLSRDAASKRTMMPRGAKAKGKGSVRRLYTQAFCPLLPRAVNFFGALGHFRKNPEVGFTLYGAKKDTATTPQHQALGGLIEATCYSVVDPNTTTLERQNIVSNFLRDLKAVVADHLNGTVTGKLGTQWLDLEKFRHLDEDTLCRKLCIHCFVPDTYEERRRELWEQKTSRRAVESVGETWNVVGSKQREQTIDSLPLNKKLQMVMRERSLKNKDLARIFSVSETTICYWLRGWAPNKQGKYQIRSIPNDMVPFILDWIKTDKAPNTEEVIQRASKRPGIPKKDQLAFPLEN